MAIVHVCSGKDYDVFFADNEKIFELYPAVDSYLQNAQKGIFEVKVTKEGKSVFQIIIRSERDIKVAKVEAEAVFCLSTKGYTQSGKPFRRKMPVEKDKPWALWCLVELTDSGKLSDTVVLEIDGEAPIEIPIRYVISENANYSLDNMYSMARLEWLNCREGNEETVIKGFSPVSVGGRTVHILGRDIIVARNGGIDQIDSYFTGNNTSLAERGSNILSRPLGYHVYEDGKELNFTNESFCFDKISDVKASWKSVNTCGDLQLVMRGFVEFDGTVRLDAEIINPGQRNLSVRLCHYPEKEFCKYFVGLGKQGTKAGEEFSWKWDGEKRQDSYWVGAVNGGLFVAPKGSKNVLPFVNIYFHQGKKNMPKNWVNRGRGTASYRKDTSCYAFDTGIIEHEEHIRLNCELMVSPFKLIYQKEFFGTHYYHQNYNVVYDESSVLDAMHHGCKHINLHHGNDILPLLNYPLYNESDLKVICETAEKNGADIIPYYTIRELTARLPELTALKSLRYEIFPAPKKNKQKSLWQNGKVDDFIIRNFNGDAIPAWKHTFVGGQYDGWTDPTVLTNADGRLGNFYVGCVSYMVKNMGIGGLYIDDYGGDRVLLRRIRRIFDKYKPDAKIDLHSWNHFEDQFGAGYAHSCLLYMGIFPYLSSLWLGESFDYDHSSPEYLLTEVSGIPFGLMGEMLGGTGNGGNPFRGMLFGMTNRYPYYSYFTDVSPLPIWELSEKFDIGNSEMIGFWEDQGPAASGVADVLCTTYHNHEKDSYLCVFANFSGKDIAFTPNFKRIKNKKCRMPELDKIQSGSDYHGETIKLTPTGGAIFIME